MMGEDDKFRRRNFARQLEKYSLEENQDLGECVEMFKKEYDPEMEYFKGTTRYDAKCIRFVVQTPNCNPPPLIWTPGN